jgi:hypothetical protein
MNKQCGVWTLLLSIACGAAEDTQEMKGSTTVDIKATASGGGEQVGGLEALSLDRDSLGRPLGPLTASIAAQSSPTARLLARVEVQPNEMIEFYESEDGVIEISGAGAPAGGLKYPPEALRGLEVEKIWALVTSNAPVPQSLTQALARSTSRMPDRMRGSLPIPNEPALSPKWGGGVASSPEVRHESSKAGAPVLVAGGWCDVDYFYSSYSLCWDGNWKVCLNNWWNGVFAQHGDVYILESNVCPATGQVVYYGNTIGAFTVPQNTVRWWRSHPDCDDIFTDCPTRRAEVQYAGGQRFHFRFLVTETPI